MKTKYYLAAFTVIAAFSFVACQKDEDPKEEQTTTTTTGTPAADAKSLARTDFNEMYKAAAVAGFTWNGNTTDCDAGTLSQEIFDKALLRIKYFRKAAGLSNTGIVMTPALSAKSQQNALMIKANNALSHTPPNTWKCYTADGAEAAQKGNIALGVSDVNNIGLWMQDEGSGNEKVGHRRWILYSRATQFGFGCTNSSGSLWVINSGAGSTALPTKTPAYIAWPPKGFVPRDVVYPRWSLSIPAPSYPYQVDFTNATVKMADANGKNVPLTIEYANPIESSYMGDNTLTWRPSGINLTLNTDQNFTVTVSNVMVGGTAKKYEYTVTIFKP
jgi:uncharacterized protein YkwD